MTTRQFPGGNVAEFRAYIVGEDGHFIRSVELVCPDEEVAKQYAEQLVDGHDVELWQAGRRISLFKKKSRPT
jgi:hypothetical protein